MEYQLFRRLLDEGEKEHVDFKIACDAFKDSTVSSRSELAKDICAMANNGGKRASYIVIGVNDNIADFRSVDNDKLTDDQLQDFCKKAIYPPPRVKVHKENWRRALRPHRGKEFVIIQIGPHRRQAFRLAQDFICYRERVCHRRNEVWIRRGATSDLATPEEIGRLVSGQAPIPDPAIDQRHAERLDFATMSLGQRRAVVGKATIANLEKQGYGKLPKEYWLRTTTWISEYIRATSYSSFWKQLDSTLFIYCVMPCQISLTLKQMRGIYNAYGGQFGLCSEEFMGHDSIPKVSVDNQKKVVRAVRRICLFPVLNPVTVKRIEQAMPSCRKINPSLHFYRHFLRSYGGRSKVRKLPSSSEIAIIANIRSRMEYVEAHQSAVHQMEEAADTVIDPSCAVS